MNPIVYPLLAVPVVSAVLLARMLLKVHETEELADLRDKRMESFGKINDFELPVTDEEVSKSPLAGLRNLLHGMGGERIDRSERGSKLAAELARADLRLRVEEWLTIVALITVAFAGLSYLRFHSVIVSVVFALVGYFGTGWFLGFKKRRHQRKFDQGLAETVVTLSNSLKAGYSFTAALKVISDSGPYPVNVEFGRVVGAVSLGAHIDDALDSLVKRNGSEDLELLVAAVKINRATGGNMSEILDTIEGTIRGRIRIKGEIRTLTAQARASGYIIALLPIGLGGILALISPTYFTPMFHKTVGLIMLGIGGLSIVMGSAIIRKIVNIKV